MENLTHGFKEMNLVLHLIQELQNKVKLCGLQNKKEGIIHTVYFVQREFF